MLNLTENHFDILVAAEFFNNKPDFMGFSPLTFDQRDCADELVSMGLLEETMYGYVITEDGIMVVENYASDDELLN